MSGSPVSVPLVVFEAAGCLMAVPASEIGQFVQASDERLQSDAAVCDLGEYFDGARTAGPLLRWARGTRGAWLRVRRVIDVVAVPLSALRPLPQLMRRHWRSRAFLAAGTTGADVFLLLDPGRLALDFGLWAE
jgi:hypothetical protein